jgi:hypothetical protein
VLDDVIEDLGLVDLARTGAESLRDRGLMRKVMAVRGQGREDEILVVDSQQRRLTVGPARHEPDLTQEAFDLLGSDGCAALASLTSLLKGLPHALMKAKDLAPSPAEGSLSSFWPDLGVSDSFMLASYPGEGSHYLKHRDNDVVPQATHEVAWQAPLIQDRVGGSWEGPPGSRVGDRAVTAIMYLNRNWEAADGGCLRMYREDQPFVDIQPSAGRLVIFDSRRMEHEVMPTRRQRWALSSWIPALDMFES